VAENQGASEAVAAGSQYYHLRTLRSSCQSNAPDESESTCKKVEGDTTPLDQLLDWGRTHQLFYEVGGRIVTSNEQLKLQKVRNELSHQCEHFRKVKFLGRCESPTDPL
jgi:hypothetical protein